MGASASEFRVIDNKQPRPAGTAREQLELAARLLPESVLKTVILATLAEREPTPREAIAWAVLLQSRRLGAP
jgi:hypothetical protein